MLCGKSSSARLMLTFLTAIGLSLFLGQSLWAKDISGMLHVPDSGKTQIITLNDGSTLTGKITRVDADKVVFTTQMGEMTISIDKIAEIKEAADKLGLENEINLEAHFPKSHWSKGGMLIVAKHEPKEAIIQKLAKQLAKIKSQQAQQQPIRR